MQQWKEDGNFVCGEQVPVKGYYTRVQLRCNDNVEAQYYGKGRQDICVYCCNDEDLLSTDQLKEANLGGEEPLPLCSFCAGLNIKAPTKSGRPNQFEKGQQAKAAKKKLHERAVDKGRKMKTTKKKQKRG